ncbi:hypothetical protein [Chitinimonas koreensis]|nr:hypothetical protein [Chitinimonas koreensis]
MAKQIWTAEFVARQLVLPFDEEFVLLAQQAGKAIKRKAAEIKVIVREIVREVPVETIKTIVRRVAVEVVREVRVEVVQTVEVVKPAPALAPLSPVQHLAAAWRGFTDYVSKKWGRK